MNLSQPTGRLALLLLLMAGLVGCDDCDPTRWDPINATPCPLPDPSGDSPCGVAHPLLLALTDDQALACIREWTGVELDCAARFRNDSHDLLPRCFWTPEGREGTFVADETNDFRLRLTGNKDAPQEIQSHSSVVAPASQGARLWVAFRQESTLAVSDTTVGLEHFGLDMLGGFAGADTTSACWAQCDEARASGLGYSEATSSCVLYGTNGAHYALLLDLDTSPTVAHFADGSACGHLPASPFGEGSFTPLEAELTRDTDHLLYIAVGPEDAASPVTVCLDGEPLGVGGLPAETMEALWKAEEGLTFRATANVDSDDRVQLELDWVVQAGRDFD